MSDSDFFLTGADRSRPSSRDTRKAICCKSRLSWQDCRMPLQCHSLPFHATSGLDWCSLRPMFGNSIRSCVARPSQPFCVRDWVQICSNAAWNFDLRIYIFKLLPLLWHIIRCLSPRWQAVNILSCLHCVMPWRTDFQQLKARIYWAAWNDGKSCGKSFGKKSDVFGCFWMSLALMENPDMNS